MKKILLPTIILILSGLTIFGQFSAVKMNETFQPLQNDSVLLIPVSGLRGEVTWQSSYDSVIWTDIEANYGDTLAFVADETKAYRLIVNEGTCDTIASDTIVVYKKYSDLNDYLLSGVPGDVIANSYNVTFSYHDSLVTYGIVYYKGKFWMDRNLGADKVADSINDPLSYGDLYQWGRESDGHELRSSGITVGLTPARQQPGHGLYIRGNSSNKHYDWNADTTWHYRWIDKNGNKTIADPCPKGWRVPTCHDWDSAAALWENKIDGFNSELKLPVAGFRYCIIGSIIDTGKTGIYWASTYDRLNLKDDYVSVSNSINSEYGFSVRCIYIGDTCTAPVQPWGISGVQRLERDSSGYVYSVETVKGASEYIWSVPVGAEIVSGQGTTNITVNYDSISGYIKVQSKNSCYESDTTKLKVTFKDESLIEGDSVTFNYNGEEVTYGLVNYFGDIWMDRNLGASRVATAVDDAEAYGDLFQWGREDDGHQVRNSATTGTLAPSGSQPGHNKYITTSGTSVHDWNVNNSWINRWWDQGKKTSADVCPEGFRVPSYSEWDLMSTLKGWTTITDAFNSELKLPAAGVRLSLDGSVYFVGVNGVYWSSDPSGEVSWNINIDDTRVLLSDDYRAIGMSVRCIKE